MTDATLTAEKLLQAGAVKLNPSSPFTWASGWKSPIYCDNRKLLSLPYIRDFIKSELANAVFEMYPEADVIAGVATAGIPWGIMVADQLKLPFIYVRPKPKEHGLGNQIEGTFSKNQKTVVIEDLISTAKSSLQVIEVLRREELAILGIISIFNYDFKKAEDDLRSADVDSYSLTNYPALIDTAVSKGIVSNGQKEVLLKWRSDPANWTRVQ